MFGHGIEAYGVRYCVLVEINRHDRRSLRRIKVTRVETVAAANLQHLAIWLQNHPREDAPLYPEAVVLRRKLPVLIQEVVEPFGTRMEPPLQRELNEMGERRDLSDDEI